MRFANRQKGNGFSLVELLIAIVILVLLIGLLVPSLAWVRRRANITRCAANLRQIGIALQSYRLNHHDVLPIARSMPEPFSLPKQVADPRFADPIFIMLADYLPTTSGVYRCPGDNTQVFERCSALSPRQLGISYIYFVFPKMSYAGRKQVIMWDYGGDSLHGLIKPPFHPDGANVLHLDGSVDYGSN